MYPPTLLGQLHDSSNVVTSTENLEEDPWLSDLSNVGWIGEVRRIA